MTTKHVRNGLFWVLIFGSLHGLLVTGGRTVYYFGKFNSPTYGVWFFTKALVYSGFLLIGYLLFLLMKQYRQTGFFDQGSVRLVRLIGVTLIGVSVFSSAFNVLTETTILPQAKTLPNASAFLFQFVLNYLFEAPVLLFVTLLTFLFATFMQQAIAVKRDNEAII